MKMKVLFENKEEALCLVEQAIDYIRLSEPSLDDEPLLLKGEEICVSKPVGRPRKALPFREAVKRLKREHRKRKYNVSNKKQKWQWVREVHKLRKKIQKNEGLSYKEAFSKAAQRIRNTLNHHIPIDEMRKD